MPPRSNVPIRIGGSKSRLGCRTCKQRHVKCDERQPICHRCEKAKRQCTYEPLQSQAPQPSEHGQIARLVVPLSAQYRDASPASSLNRSVSPYGPYEVLEVSAVKSFATHLGRQLAGCFSNDIWCHIIPRVAQHEPSIWHAMVAVSMLDTGIMLGHDPYGGSSHIRTAAKHYGKAMQELTVRLSSAEHARRKDVVLLSCILFAVFECLQNHIPSALKHISGGTKLLIEWEYEARTDNHIANGSYLNYASLKPMFLTLDSQAVQMGVIGFRNYHISMSGDDQPYIPSSFSTAQEAHASLNHIFNCLTHWGYWIDIDIRGEDEPDEEWLRLERQRLQMKLYQWDAAFNTLLKLFHAQPTTLLLLVQRKVIHAFFGKQMDGPSEMEWDKYIPVFRQAVEYAEAYMESMTDNSSAHTAYTESCCGFGHEPKPVLTIAMDIVMSLFLISVKCRESNIRRAALRMLKACDRREGIWDSHLCGAAAEKIIQMEEANALPNGHIPAAARIFELDVRLSDEGRGDVTHKRLVMHEDGSHHIEKFDNVSW